MECNKYQLCLESISDYIISFQQQERQKYKSLWMKGVVDIILSCIKYASNSRCLARRIKCTLSLSTNILFIVTLSPLFTTSQHVILKHQNYVLKQSGLPKGKKLLIPHSHTYIFRVLYTQSKNIYLEYESLCENLLNNATF